MNENVEKPNSLEAKFLENEILNALAKHGANDTEALKEHLLAHAHVACVRSNEPYARIIDDTGRALTLDAYLSELKQDAKYASKFRRVPQISRADQAAINNNVTKIARGEVEVI